MKKNTIVNITTLQIMFFILLTFAIAACGEGASLNAPDPTVVVDTTTDIVPDGTVSAGETATSGQTAAATTTTTNVSNEVVTIYPTATITTTPTCTSTDTSTDTTANAIVGCGRDEILKRIHDDVDFGAIINPSELINSKLMQTLFGLVPDAQSIYTAITTPVDGLLAYMGASVAGIEHLALVLDTTSTGADVYFVLRFATALSQDALDSFYSTLSAASVIDVAMINPDGSLAPGYFQMRAATSSGNVSFNLSVWNPDSTSTIVEQMAFDCILESQYLSCAETAIYSKMTDVMANETLSAYYSAKGSILQSCASLQAFLDPIVFQSQIDTITNTTIKDTLTGLVGTGTAVLSFSTSTAAMASDPNTTFGYGALSLSYYNNQDWQTRITIEFTDQLIDLLKVIIQESMSSAT